MPARLIVLYRVVVTGQRPVILLFLLDATGWFSRRLLPVLTILGRRALHTGPLGTASVLKVMTNYLATANLITLSEALITSKMAGMDLNTTYEAIRISSGNSFVHETESQVILNGSRDINFTMDLVLKDIVFFNRLLNSIMCRLKSRHF